LLVLPDLFRDHAGAGCFKAKREQMATDGVLPVKQTAPAASSGQPMVRLARLAVSAGGSELPVLHQLDG
jgi:hypothetical protein